MKDMELFVTVIGKEEPGNPDPIFHVPGGPGASSEAYAPILGSTYVPLALELDRQIFFVDQRGTGQSIPFLTCDDPKKPRDCVDEWKSAGLDTKAFTTAFAADDIADVAAAFGATKVNLWGASYGSRLALETVRRHPDIIRSLIIESVDSADTPLEKITGVRGALGRISARCKSDPACSKLTSDLAADVDRVALQLSSRPLTTSSGKMDATVFADTTQQLMEASIGRSTVPLFVNAVSRGDVATVDAVLLSLSTEPALTGKFSVGMQLLTNCSDIAPFGASKRLSTLEPPVDELFDRSSFAAMSDLADETCDPWKPGTASVDLVTSDKPTLIVAGSDDSNTPVENATRVAAKLSASSVVEFPGYGHFPLHRGGNPCAAQIFVAFVQQPLQSVDQSCVTEGAVYGALEQLGTVELRPVSLDNVGISAALPTDWLPAGKGTFVGAGSSVTVTLTPGDVDAVVGSVAKALGAPSPTSRPITVGDTTWTQARIGFIGSNGEATVEIALVAADEQTLSVSIVSPKDQADTAAKRLNEILLSIKPL
jgi:pimeloyl-ACP methyl ester carboxylesterase